MSSIIQQLKDLGLPIETINPVLSVAAIENTPIGSLLTGIVEEFIKNFEAKKERTLNRSQCLIRDQEGNLRLCPSFEFIYNKLYDSAFQYARDNYEMIRHVDHILESIEKLKPEDVEAYINKRIKTTTKTWKGRPPLK